MSFGGVFRTILVLLVGGAVVFVVWRTVLKPAGGGLTDELVRGTVRQSEHDTLDSVRKAVRKVLPAIAENPILEPAIQTKKDIEQTVETVRSLPNEQKEAICKQVCQ